MSDMLLRLIGWQATLLHGDMLVADRWRWLKPRLPITAGMGERVLDAGCGSGAFTMGAARRGYEAVGLSWDKENQTKALHRAEILRLKNVTFPIGDLRALDQRHDFVGAFDIVLNFENIEHILDDRKLMIDLARCLKPGGRLCMSTPNYYYAAMSRPGEEGPFSVVEDGGHVRRGYTPAMLRELCDIAGLEIEEIGYVSHYFSQITAIAFRTLVLRLGVRLGWALAIPLRALPPLLDGWLGKWIGRIAGRPGYSITLVAYKPRFGAQAKNARVREARTAEG